MPTALGVVELIDETTAFDSSITEPTRPGVRRAFDQSLTQVSASASKKSEADLRETLKARFEEALEEARTAVVRERSTTSLIRLAQVLEAVGSSEEAASIALEVLTLAKGRLADRRQFEPFSVRLALEVLVRSGNLDVVEEYSLAFPIDATTRLTIGSTFAELGNFELAHRLIDPVEDEERNATLAYLLLNEGKDSAAIPLLRSALRYAPGDAESAHNLSIAFMRSGARRKALSSALRATRTDPGRQDISLHYLELLMMNGRAEEVLGEADRLLQQGIQQTAKLAVLQARASLALGQTLRGEKFLGKALQLVSPEKDSGTFTEIKSNLLRIRVVTGRMKRESAIAQLNELSEEFPQHSVVASNLAQTASDRKHAGPLRAAYERSMPFMTEARASYISFQIAQLEGDNASAADAALRWAQLEPGNVRAISSAMIALGIGAERWEDALPFAEKALSSEDADPVLLNNAAYIYAMTGRTDEAIRALAPYADHDPTMKATLGLAHLAADNIDLGFRLYREAAKEAGSKDHEFLSLIASYQALVVRQLHVDQHVKQSQIAAVSLASPPLPSNWSQRPEFLRLQTVAKRHGYPWPLTL